MKAQEVLERKKISVDEIVDARKVKIEEEEAWNLLSKGEKIVVAKGSKVVEFDIADKNRFDIMQISLGRSGTLRAPAVRIGKKWMVGFNEAIYSAL